MSLKMGEVHEPEAELHSAEEAIADAARLRRALRPAGSEKVVVVHMPLWALLEALDALEAPELEQVAQRVEKRLAVVGH